RSSVLLGIVAARGPGCGRRRGVLAAAEQLGQHAVDQGQHLVGDRIDPGALGERLPGERMEALHPGGHASGADVPDLLGLTELRATGEIALMGGTVGGGEPLLLLHALGQFGHQTGRLETRELEREPGQRQVERGGERRAVLEPGGGADHGGAAAAASAGDRDDAAHLAPELRAHHLVVLRGGRGLEGKWGEGAHWSVSSSVVSAGSCSETSSSVDPVSSGMSSGVRRLEPSTLSQSTENHSPSFAASWACSASVRGTSRPEVSVSRYWVSPGIANSSRSRARAATKAGSSQRATCARRESTCCSWRSTCACSSPSFCRWAT